VVPAWYMRFTPDHMGSPDRVGGLPSHLPPAFPLSPHTGRPMGFLAQFYCHPERLPLPDLLCLQVYQVLEDYDPFPAIVAVPVGAAENVAGDGVSKPGVRPHDIAWEGRPDPDAVDPWQTELAESKAGGVCYFSDCLRVNEQLALQLSEQPCGLNFGGYTLVVAVGTGGQIRAALG
jgi:hypothetical protein